PIPARCGNDHQTRNDDIVECCEVVAGELHELAVMATSRDDPHRARRGALLMARIAVGGFQHETNTFAPQRASWADFERADAWPGFVRGSQLIEAVEGFNIPIAGAVKALQTLGHELLPLCWCSAPPSSYVEKEAYEKVTGWIVEDLRAQG